MLESLRPGSPVILTSTIGPEAARALADRLDDAGYPLVDAPIRLAARSGAEMATL